MKREPKPGEKFQQMKGEPLGLIESIARMSSDETDARLYARIEYSSTIPGHAGLIREVMFTDMSFTNGKFWRLTTAAIGRL